MKEDELVRENPCRIKGYDRYHTPERSTATVEQVHKLASAMPARYAALIIVAAYSGLRWGELVALRRSDLDLSARTIRVTRKLAKLRQGLVYGAPKSEAGKRTVTLPAVAVPVLTEHLKEYVDRDASALIFTGAKGAQLRSSNFHNTTKWTELVKSVGLPAGFHFHDLRHTGNDLAARSGATTRELMHRMGHGSMRAALIYQHASSERDREIADAIDKRIKAEIRKRDAKKKAGEKVARPKKRRPRESE
ncbi:MAG: tyrosine-type recombinase/integrase [Micromonosporaceae bacterium]